MALRGKVLKSEKIDNNNYYHSVYYIHSEIQDFIDNKNSLVDYKGDMSSRRKKKLKKVLKNEKV